MQIILRSRVPFTNAEITTPSSVFASAISNVDKITNDQDRELFNKLNDFSLPFLLAKGAFDTDRITSHPRQMTSEVADAQPAEQALLSLLIAAGAQPISYRAENGGKLAVNIVRQLQETRDRRLYEKSIGALRGHTDGSFYPTPQEYLGGYTKYSCSPDFVGLAGIRNPDRVSTRLAILSDVLAELTEDEKIELQKPIFILRPQTTFSLPPTLMRVGPILWQEQAGHWCCRFSHSKIAVARESHPKAYEALENFSHAVARSYQDIALEPGEVLIFNNRTVVHGRGPVGDSNARWLLRTYGHLPETPRISLDQNCKWICE